MEVGRERHHHNKLLAAPPPRWWRPRDTGGPIPTPTHSWLKLENASCPTPTAKLLGSHSARPGRYPASWARVWRALTTPIADGPTRNQYSSDIQRNCHAEFWWLVGYGGNTTRKPFLLGLHSELHSGQ
jgi:hypothetical protein